MIVLDTNVLSEPLRTRPDSTVLAWLDGVTDDVALTSISVGEILAGVRALPSGRRRGALMAAVERTLAIYADQVLPYDERAAHTYAAMQESRRSAEQALSVEDGMIAAICGARGLALATRNTKDFDDLGITLINPWVDQPQPN
jgi:predicted nucleic acid-binding protein